ncbi:MAG: AI-2E family transporter [Planctomycetota bacterium]|nr:AI-2E family transporter [Planctomycetota bacterium]
MDRAVYRGLLLFAATSLAIWAFALVLLPFIVPIAWALCTFTVTMGPYGWLAARWHKPRLVALTMVLGTGLIVLLPLIYIGAVFVDQARQLDLTPALEKLKEAAPDVIENLDGVLAYVLPAEPAEANAEAAAGGAAAPEAAGPPADRLGSFVERAQDNFPRVAAGVFGVHSVGDALGFLLTPAAFLVGLLLTLVTQFFLYREAKALRSLVVDVSPLSEGDTDELLGTLRGATVSAVMGGLLVALAQGLLGTLMFWIAGIQSPVMWGVVMAGLSLLPFGGTAFVWLPAGIILLLTGQPGAGWFVLIFGGVIVSGADSVLRPWLLSRMSGEGVKIHPLMLFFATISGIGLFGISGIVFGPLLIAVLSTLVRLYQRHGIAHHGEPVV